MRDLVRAFVGYYPAMVAYKAKEMSKEKGRGATRPFCESILLMLIFLLSSS